MDLQSYIIGILTGVIATSIGAIISSSTYERTLQRERKEKLTREETQVHIPQDETKSGGKSKKPAVKLGAVNRPNASEIEKKENPTIKEEEDEWEKGLKDAGIIQMFANNFGRGIWTY